MIIAHFDPKNMNATTYAEVLRQLEVAGQGSPKGRVHHVSYGDTGALRVIDTWDTPQNMEAFGKVLLPILGSLGIEMDPPHVTTVHNIIRG
ncbi:MAG TPA: hypothetical protein VL137_06485 [Polyangiaceae bacterium]|jgi:hypothetical protein|nr:hypothetical protein [Polyangiaceae bacterium]